MTYHAMKAERTIYQPKPIDVFLLPSLKSQQNRYSIVPVKKQECSLTRKISLTG